MLSDNAVDHEPDKQLAHACAELSRRLRAGEECRAEQFLEAAPSLASSMPCVLELIFTEYHVRQELGQHPDPAEWQTRFPQWWDQLQSRLQSPLPAPDSQAPDPATVVQTPLQSQPVAQEAAAGPGFGHYQLFEELGRGGMGVVYKARDTRLDRFVALKMIRAGVLARPEEVERFYREARAAAKLNHRHIITLHEISRQEDQHYFTMAYAPGGSLSEHRQRLFADPRAAAGLVEKIARAVHHAHTKGILHRDLKPGNVLLDEYGEPLVSDFGLAKFLDADAELTQTGVIVGTPAYMSPEQASGRADAVTARSDVWSLGVLLYELLTGQRPFAGKGTRQVSQQILTRDPPRPRTIKPGLDRALETIVLKCLEKDPARRYATAEEVAEDLGGWKRGVPIRARPQSWGRRVVGAIRRHGLLSGAAALMAVAAVVVLIVMGPSDHERQPADPDQTMKGWRNLLAQGQSVTLIGSTGLPGWSHWRFGRGAIKDCPLGDETFYLHSFDPCLLELMPAPLPERFVLRADVRHFDSDGGEVGIYFAYQERSTSKGVERLYCELIFSDWRDRPRVKVQTRRRRNRGAVPELEWEGSLGVSRNIARANNRLPPWRTLKVQVTAQALEAYLGPDLIGKCSRADLVKWARLRLRDNPELEANKEYPPRGAVGLFVQRGGAAFRRVIIQPLQ
jgi:tRNA A-37 threonylcarbamoyl transferase component Bud32